MKLFEIAQEELDLLNEIEELDGELTPELEERLKINEANMAKKMEGYCKAIRYYEMTVANAKAEKERLDKLIKRSERSQQWLKDAMLNVMNATGKLKGVSAGTYTVGTRKSTSVNIIDESLIPKKYMTKKIEIKIDKVSIKDVLKEGGKVKGAELLEKQTISIR